MTTPAITNVKYAAMQALADALGDTLDIPVKVFFSDQEDVVYPSLAIVPQSFSFLPWQAEEHAGEGDSDQSVGLFEVGTYEGACGFRLYAKSAPERELQGQRVIDAFMQREGQPGLVVVQTPNVVTAHGPTIYPAYASFVIGDEEWRDEMVFTNKRYAFMTLDADFPVLVSRAAPNIEQLLIELSTEPTDPVPGDPEAQPQEEFAVAQDALEP